MSDWPEVLPNDDGIRPAGKPDECFYCGNKVGQPHGEECVIVKKLVRVRYIIEVDEYMPHDWKAHDLEFHRNESSWCANNVVDVIGEFVGKLDKSGSCLCGGDRFRVEFVSVIDDTPHRDEK